jgi:excisionase family DNA binding protein
MENQRMTVTVEEAATILGVDRNKAYEAARSGEIPTIRIGKRILVPVASLERLLGLEAGQFGAEPNDGSAGKTAPLAEEEERRCRRALKPNARRPNRAGNCKRQNRAGNCKRHTNRAGNCKEADYEHRAGNCKRQNRAGNCKRHEPCR